MKGSSWKGKHILTACQFSRADVDSVFALASDIKANRDKYMDVCKGMLSCNIFYEPSTRTDSSFEAAMKLLGGQVISLKGMANSSVAKGETLEDTVRTLEEYSDVLVLRHPEVGAAKRAAKVLKNPILNAGDGAGEHPTQAMLDLYTIQAEFGRIDGLTITIVGDLKFGRTVHSLVRMLALFKVAQLNLVSPEYLQIPDKYLAEVKKSGISVTQTSSLESVLASSDVLYVTRVQKERLDAKAKAQLASGVSPFHVTADLLARCKAKASLRILHPLPRVDELDAAIDSDPRAAYFRQMKYGLYVRMALLALVLGVASPPSPPKSKL
eukprot:g6671.t1